MYNNQSIKEVKVFDLIERCANIFGIVTIDNLIKQLSEDFVLTQKSMNLLNEETKNNKKIIFDENEKILFITDYIEKYHIETIYQYDRLENDFSNTPIEIIMKYKIIDIIQTYCSKEVTQNFIDLIYTHGYKYILERRNWLYSLSDYETDLEILTCLLDSNSKKHIREFTNSLTEIPYSKLCSRLAYMESIKLICYDQYNNIKHYYINPNIREYIVVLLKYFSLYGDKIYEFLNI